MQEILAYLFILVGGGFIKILTTLQIFRVGLGLYGAAAGVLVLVVSVLFSLFVSSASIEVGSILTSDFNAASVHSNIESEFIPFLEKNTKKEEVKKFQLLRQKIKQDESQEIGAPDFSTLLFVFSLDELRKAFYLGLIFIIPFLLIDLFIVHILQLLSITQISAWCVSLPLKLGLFLAVDGWGMIMQRLLLG